LTSVEYCTPSGHSGGRPDRRGCVYRFDPVLGMASRKVLAARLQRAGRRFGFSSDSAYALRRLLIFIGCRCWADSSRWGESGGQQLLAPTAVDQQPAATSRRCNSLRTNARRAPVCHVPLNTLNSLNSRAGSPVLNLHTMLIGRSPSADSSTTGPHAR
jgi:hypothetical protein